MIVVTKPNTVIASRSELDSRIGELTTLAKLGDRTKTLGTASSYDLLTSLMHSKFELSEGQVRCTLDFVDQLTIPDGSTSPRKAAQNADCVASAISNACLGEFQFQWGIEEEPKSISRALVLIAEHMQATWPVTDPVVLLALNDLAETLSQLNASASLPARGHGLKLKAG